MIKKWNSFILESNNDLLSPIHEVENLLLELVDDEFLKAKDDDYYVNNIDVLSINKSYTINRLVLFGLVSSDGIGRLDKNNIAEFIEFYKSIEDIMKYLTSVNSNCTIYLDDDFVYISYIIKDEKYQYFIKEDKSRQLNANIKYIFNWNTDYYELDITDLNIDVKNPLGKKATEIKFKIELDYVDSKIRLLVKTYTWGDSFVIENKEIFDFLISEIEKLGFKFIRKMYGPSNQTIRGIILNDFKLIFE